MTLQQTPTYPILDELLAGQIISADQYAAARALMAQQDQPFHEPFDDLATGVVWLATHELFSREDLERLAIPVNGESSEAANVIRQRAMDEISAWYAAYEQAIEEHERDLKRLLWAQAFPGPRWAWIAGVMCVMVAGLWYTNAPDISPACDSAETTNSLRLELGLAPVKQPGWTSASPDSVVTSDANKVEVTNIRQIGHLKAEQSLGCTATLSSPDQKVSIAYTVRPVTGSDTQMRVVIGLEAIIRARYRDAE